MPAAMLRFLPVPVTQERKHRPSNDTVVGDSGLSSHINLSRGHANAIHQPDDVTGGVSTGLDGAGNKRSHRSHPLGLQVGVRGKEV